MAHPTGPVAEEFAARVATVESEWLSPLAVRSYETRGRLQAENEICPLRTPFQRDRDRIVHCKSFRRLKGKTQVFIAPQGDHFRTRLTHTLEVSGISRNVARALRLNEDLTEAIALGHDLGHSPFGHTGEGALDHVLEEQFGRGFRHNEHSLRIVDVLEHEGRGLNLTEEVRDGILHHTGEVEPGTLEAAIVRLVDRFAYVNHDIDDAVRAGILDPTALPPGPIGLLGATSSERIDALVHDLVETSDAAGSIGQTDDHRAALLELRAFMFDQVYLRPDAREQAGPVERIVEDLLRHFVDHPEELPSWFEGDDVTRATDWVAGMTDGYALRVHAELARGVVSRIAPDSLEAVKQAVDMIDLVSGRTPLRKSGVEWRGRCPFHEERTPSFWVDPLKKVYFCFGCQASGDAIGFIRETESLDFTGAVEWLADRYGVELQYEESSPAQDKRRRERDRLFELLNAAADFYSRFLWDADEAAAARAYLADRGITDETARAFRVGYAPAAPDRVARAARSRGFTAAELHAAGLSGRGGDRFRERVTFPLADARGRVRGFGARQMPGGRPPKYLNTSDGPVFTKSEIIYGLDHARRAIAAAGEAIVVEGYTDVLMLHQAGVERVVASMGTALTERQVAELRRVCSTVRLAFDSDAAGQEASLRGMELAQRAGLRVLVVSLPAGQDPADLAAEGPEAFGAALDGAEPYLTYRVRRALDAPGTRDERYQRARELLASAPQSVERDEVVRSVSGRLGLTDDLSAALVSRAPLAESVTRRRTQLTPRERDERLFLGLCLAHPIEGNALLGKLDVSHFTGASHWEAATHVRRMLAGEAQAREDEAWAPTIAELTALASREGTSEAALQELFWKLRLGRTEDELKALEQNADLSLEEQERLRELQALRLSILERIRSQPSQE